MSIISTTGPGESHPRQTPPIPFLVLVGVVIAFVVLFYQVIRPLALPLFLAAVIALLAHPVHERVTRWSKGRESLAAGIVTVLIVLIIVGPLTTAVWFAVIELRGILTHLEEVLAGGGDLQAVIAEDVNPRLAPILEQVERWIPIEPEMIRQATLRLGAETGKLIYERTLDLLGSVPRMALGLAMFLVALYFFLRDGLRMVKGWEQLTPMSLEHDQLIRNEFARVCRGVVLGTVAAALVQAALFGVALLLIDQISGAGIGRWTFLLSMVTAATSMIPFLGAAVVWVPTAIFLFLTGHPVAALILALFGALIVSLADNVVKVVVIGETAQLHPLLVFVSVFGGIQLVGFLGIFLGPIIGAVLVAMLRILRREIISRNRLAEGPQEQVIRPSS